MNVYEKLQSARIKLQGTDLKKTGHNKFAGYYYFELGDFLPQAQNVFHSIGLCGTVSFGQELATLEVVNTEKTDEKIVFSTPMASANLKGAHDIQNLGAVQTYLRRYLWVAALEIVEHDAVDSSEPQKPVQKATGARAVTVEAWDALDAESQQFLQKIADEATGYLNNGLPGEAVAYIKEQRLDADEQTALWSRFDSKQRSAMKAVGKAAE